jgi:hypothetical protein
MKPELTCYLILIFYISLNITQYWATITWYLMYTNQYQIIIIMHLSVNTTVNSNFPGFILSILVQQYRISYEIRNIDKNSMKKMAGNFGSQTIWGFVPEVKSIKNGFGWILRKVLLHFNLNGWSNYSFYERDIALISVLLKGIISRDFCVLFYFIA